MGHMSYCRYRNTVADLQDCIDSIEERCSEDEHRARKRLVMMCTEIARDYVGDDDPAVWADALPRD